MARGLLSIHPVPFKSSRLAIPPSPMSPKSPLSPVKMSRIQPPSGSRAKTFKHRSAPPQTPSHWLWQCHLCNRVWSLGITRRCLDDGHYFCAGTTIVKLNKANGGRKIVRHKGCASEFDYSGWKSHGDWRRRVIQEAKARDMLIDALRGGGRWSTSQPAGQAWLGTQWATPSGSGSSTDVSTERNCWDDCDYPSECRWKKQLGTVVPAQESTANPAAPITPTVGVSNATNETFTDILTRIAEGGSGQSEENIAAAPQVSPQIPNFTSTLDSILDGADRRKRKSAELTPSPLASHPPTPNLEDVQMEDLEPKEGDGGFWSMVIGLSKSSTAKDRSSAGISQGAVVEKCTTLEDVDMA